MEIRLALFYPHQLLNFHPQKFPLFLVITYFPVKNRFPWYGDTWSQYYIPLIPYQSTRLWTIGAKAQFRVQCSGDRWGGKGPDTWKEKGREATEHLVSPLFVNPVLGSWHIISFTPYYYIWDRCDSWHFSGWETEAHRIYTTSTCVHLITNKQVSKSLKPKLWGLINPKAYVLPLTSQPTGKVPEACEGGKGKERRWESSYSWRIRRGSGKVLKYVWACYIFTWDGL